MDEWRTRDGSIDGERAMCEGGREGEGASCGAVWLWQSPTHMREPSWLTTSERTSTLTIPLINIPIKIYTSRNKKRSLANRHGARGPLLICCFSGCSLWTIESVWRPRSLRITRSEFSAQSSSRLELPPADSRYHLGPTPPDPHISCNNCAHRVDWLDSDVSTNGPDVEKRRIKLPKPRVVIYLKRDNTLQLIDS